MNRIMNWDILFLCSKFAIMKTKIISITKLPNNIKQQQFILPSRIMLISFKFFKKNDCIYFIWSSKRRSKVKHSFLMLWTIIPITNFHPNAAALIQNWVHQKKLGEIEMLRFPPTSITIFGFSLNIGEKGQREE